MSGGINTHADSWPGSRLRVKAPVIIFDLNSGNLGFIC